MKSRLASMAVSAAVVLSAVGCASNGGGDQAKLSPALVVTTPVVTLGPGKIVMYGTGFTPKQEVSLVFKEPGGSLSGISGAVTPAPVANADGMWAAEWTYSAYVKMIKPGTGMISVVDPNFKTLAQAPVVFVAPPPKPKPEAAKPEAKPAAKPEAKPAAR